MCLFSPAMPAGRPITIRATGDRYWHGVHRDGLLVSPSPTGLANGQWPNQRSPGPPGPEADSDAADIADNLN